MRFPCWAMLGLALAGCTTLPITRTPGTLTAPAAQANPAAGPAPVATKAPAAAVSTGGVAQGAGVSGATNPFGLPTSISLPMPTAVINAGGANVIASGGANYRLLAAPSPVAASLGQDLLGYVLSTGMVNAMLKQVATLDLQPDTPVSLPGGQGFTAMLHLASDHAVLSIGQNGSPTGAGQILAIRYTAPGKGTAVFHMTVGTMKIELATRYDLDQGTAIADAAVAQNANTIAIHSAFAHPTTGPAFTIRSAAFRHSSVAGDAMNGLYALSANFAADGEAAAIAGVSSALTNQQLLPVSSDTDLPTGDAQARIDWYIDANGQDEPRTAASAAVQALVPAPSSFPTPFPADPAVADPFQDPRFGFPQ